MWCQQYTAGTGNIRHVAVKGLKTTGKTVSNEQSQNARNLVSRALLSAKLFTPSDKADFSAD